MNYTLILIALILTSCNSSSSNKASDFKKEGAIKVDLDTINDQISFFDIFSKVEIIELENSKEALMDGKGGLKYFLHNGLHYFMSESQYACFVFDESGKLIRRIEKKGRGPGEYSMLTCFAINKFENSLDILSPDGKIFRYDLSGEEHIETIELPDEIIAVHELIPFDSDKYLLFSFSMEKQFMVYSKKENKIIWSEFRVPEYILMRTPYHYASISSIPFISIGDTIRYFEGHDGTIYDINIEQKKLTPRYSFDFGKYNYNEDLVPQGKDIMFYYRLSSQLSNKMASSFITFKENDKFLIGSYDFKNKLHSLFYNKKTQEVTTFSKFKEGVAFFLSNADENNLYTIIPANFLHQAINNKVLDPINKEKLSRINEDSNMVLLKYTLK